MSTIIKRKDGTIVIPQSDYDNTPNDFKGIWTTEREDLENWEEVKEKFMGKRTWMPPFSLFNTTCLLVEGQKFEILPDEEFYELYTKSIKL